MNVLIICTYFPPDSCIAAVRPYMIAKYLTRYGNSVVVIRSGEIDRIPNDLKKYNETEFEIFSFLGDNCDINKLERGESIIRTQRPYIFPYIPRKIRSKLIHTKTLLYSPVKTISDIKKAKNRFKLQKDVIDQLGNRKFDIIFSTYANLENIFAGEYAAKLFHAKWIMDFRDPINNLHDQWNYFWNLYGSIAQKRVVAKADLCTCVSDGLRSELVNDHQIGNVITIYNGFDDLSYENEELIRDDRFSICYTGVLYEKRLFALDIFLKVLTGLIENGLLDKKKIVFRYAGNNSEQVHIMFHAHHIEDILEDYGFVDSSESIRIQNSSDLFLVLSWNTKKSKGVLTGKFYEGIRAKKPIIAIVAGDVPNSELKQLNRKYNYGFCLECCNLNYQLREVNEYLTNLYDNKINDGKVTYTVKKELYENFRYSNIVLRLQNIMLKLIEGKENI